jgi:hypothetical protein
VEADLYEAFGPLVDVVEDSRMRFLDRRIARTVMVGLSGELGLELDMGGGKISGTGIGYGSSNIGARREADRQSYDDGGLRGNIPKDTHAQRAVVFVSSF